MISEIFTPELAGELGGPEWLRAARSDAARRFADSEKPSADLEEWRYSRIDDVDIDRFHPSVPPAADHSALSDDLERLVAAVGRRAGLIVLSDGHVASIELDQALVAKGVTFGRLADLVDEPSAAVAPDAVDIPDPFDDMNLAFSAHPVALVVPRGVAVEAPFVVVHDVAQGSAVSCPRLVVIAGEDSQCRVVEIAHSTNVEALVVARTIVEVAQAARVHHESIQQFGDGVVQLAALVARVGQAGTFTSVHTALGGWYARLRSDCVLAGRGATGNLSALYFGSGDQMHDLRTFQTHEAPDTNSDLLFKGVLDDRSHAVYTGLIRVGHEARGTNANQTNRNIKLSDEAWAESVPNLEIHQNDVRCSHASAVGPIDADQRFYLESRGVPPEVAERLVVAGFLEEVIGELSEPAVADEVRAVVAARLGGSR